VGVKSEDIFLSLSLYSDDIDVHRGRSVRHTMTINSKRSKKKKRKNKEKQQLTSKRRIQDVGVRKWS
jgi:hypothetical protein